MCKHMYVINSQSDVQFKIWDLAACLEHFNLNELWKI